jgi:hypothetical protein
MKEKREEREREAEIMLAGGEKVSLYRQAAVCCHPPSLSYIIFYYDSLSLFSNFLRKVVIG